MGLVVAFTFGLIVAYGSYQWITNTERSVQRGREEAIVFASREILRSYVVDEGLEISDALDRVREAGKVYLYPTDDGWQLSGHYRRHDEKRWHAFLISLDTKESLVSLVVQDTDPELTKMANSDPKFSTSE
jgi:hypothetical protein